MSLQSAPLSITIKHPEEVDALLCEQPELRPYVEEIARHLVDGFGTGSTILIDVMKMYDDDVDQLLTVLVETALEDALALEQLDVFDQWWNDMPASIRARVLVDVALSVA